MSPIAWRGGKRVIVVSGQERVENQLETRSGKKKDSAAAALTHSLGTSAVATREGGRVGRREPDEPGGLMPG